MSDILEYVKQFMDPFSEKPFSEVDSLLLSWLSYLSFPDSLKELSSDEGILLKDALLPEYFNEMSLTTKSPQESIDLLIRTAISPRFRNMRMSNYVHVTDAENCIQFSAVTFHVSSEFCYLAFRGTDCSFTGWKEDMNLSLNAPIPSQELAVKYLEDIAGKFPGILVLGGHSKGGNLAVYAGAMCRDEVNKRIRQIYSHDGPGFQASELEDPRFVRIRSVICKTMPQSSMIGTLFEQECEYTIVESTARGIMQHNPFSWTIEDGGFVRKDELTMESKVIFRTLNSWIGKLNEEEREKFITVVFDILEQTGANTFDEMGANLKENIPIILKAIRDLDSTTMKFMLSCIGDLAKLGFSNLPDSMKESVSESVKEIVPESVKGVITQRIRPETDMKENSDETI